MPQFPISPARGFAYGRGVLSEKNWPPEAVLRLLSWLFGSVLLGALTLQWLFPTPETAPAERRVWGMIVGTLAFQGVGLLCVAVFLRVVKSTWREAFGIGSPGSGRAILLGLCGSALVMPVVLGLNHLSAELLTTVKVPPVPQTSVRVLQAVESPLLQIYFGLVAVGVAPVAEELFFRGILYPTIKQSGYPCAALWGTSLFFAAIHANLMTFLPLTVLALVFVLLYEHTGNLLAPIAAHGLFNLSNFLWLVFGQVQHP
jgi:membrane protease YdiL (CAAX protease family)